MSLRTVSLLAVALGLLWMAPTLASEPVSPEVARQAHRLAQELMSPFCPGRTLADCPSPDAGAVKEETRQWLQAGWSEREVRRLLAQRYGDTLVGVPRSRLGWVLPAGLLVLAAVALLLWMRRLSRAETVEVERFEPSPELSRELDEELRRRGL